MVDLWKFTSNKKRIFSGVVTIRYKLVCNQTLSDCVYVWMLQLANKKIE